MGVPQSSPEQRKAALEKAAASRRLRAELKALLKTGSLTLPKLFERADADEMVAGMISGQVTEVHDVMAAAEEAQLAFELLLEVRNRLLESYQQIMKMQA